MLNHVVAGLGLGFVLASVANYAFGRLVPRWIDHLAEKERASEGEG